MPANTDRTLNLTPTSTSTSHYAEENGGVHKNFQNCGSDSASPLYLQTNGKSTTKLAMPIFSISSQQNPLMKKEHADGHVTILHSFMHPKESTLFKILRS
jgi:hypothetical protein